MRTSVKYSEILTTQNRRMLDSWLIQGQTSFTFDESCKGYLLELNSSTIQTPKLQKESLKLIRPYLLFQVYFYPNKQLTIELIASDSQGVKRRIILTQTKSLIKNLMHARIPNTLIEKNTWLALYFNIFSLFSMCFPSKTFRSLDGIFINATCKLRRIYSVAEIDIDYLLPNGFDLPKFIKRKTQVISADSYEYPITEMPSYSEPLKKNLKASSVSLPKVTNNRQNIFYDNTKQSSSRKSIQDFQKQLVEGISFGAKKYFRANKQNDDKPVRLKEKLRKITHVHYQENAEEFIEESIEIEEKNEKNENELSLIESLQYKNFANENFNAPNYFNTNVRAALKLRHMTPPFVGIEGSVKYNPVDKSYEGSPAK